MLVHWFILVILESSVTGVLPCGQCTDLMVPSYGGFVIQNELWFMPTPDRVSCLWECYRRPRCRSFQYDQTSGQCRGYQEYLTHDQVYVGYNDTNDITTVKLCPAVVPPPLLGIPCSTSLPCQVINSTCFIDTCRCSLGLSYDIHQGACVVSCDTYGSQFSVHNNLGSDISLHMVNSFVTNLPVNDADDCKQRCLQETNFVCVIAKSHNSQGGSLCDYGAKTWQMAGAEVNVFGPSSDLIFIRECS